MLLCTCLQCCPQHLVSRDFCFNLSPQNWPATTETEDPWSSFAKRGYEGSIRVSACFESIVKMLVEFVMCAASLFSPDRWQRDIVLDIGG